MRDRVGDRPEPNFATERACNVSLQVYLPMLPQVVGTIKHPPALATLMPRAVRDHVHVQVVLRVERPVALVARPPGIRVDAPSSAVLTPGAALPFQPLRLAEMLALASLAAWPVAPHDPVTGAKSNTNAPHPAPTASDRFFLADFYLLVFLKSSIFKQNGSNSPVKWSKQHPRFGVLTKGPLPGHLGGPVALAFGSDWAGSCLRVSQRPSPLEGRI